MTTVHVVVPEGVDDPSRPSGGNTYDLEVCAGLARRGWTVRQHRVPGEWPRSDARSRRGFAGTLAAIPDGGTVVLDGLVASAAPHVVVPETRRLRAVVLVHMPLGQGAPAGVTKDHRAGESAVLRSVAGVITPSRWARDWLRSAYRLPPELVRVVLPGVAPAALVPGSAAGRRFVCVGAVTRTKGQDVLVDALAEVVDLPWSCRCVGSLDVAPAYAERVRAQVDSLGLGSRISFTGAQIGADLDAVYAAADLLVAPSRTEAYGMVVTEAVARGIPVIGADVGGLPEALGHAPGGRRPGLLVPAGDPAALAGALRRWLEGAGLRRELRGAACARRTTLPDWSATTDGVARVLDEASA